MALTECPSRLVFGQAANQVSSHHTSLECTGGAELKSGYDSNTNWYSFLFRGTHLVELAFFCTLLLLLLLLLVVVVVFCLLLLLLSLLLVETKTTAQHNCHML